MRYHGDVLLNVRLHATGVYVTVLLVDTSKVRNVIKNAGQILISYGAVDVSCSRFPAHA
jgi:hypothetical protein